MRLLNTKTWELKEFLSGTPVYAILSHTWEDEELSYQQWEARNTDERIQQMKGYQKIKSFGELARERGIEWVWVDTCCIDKKSSAELTEAINAMYRWYQGAWRCFVYLSDLHDPQGDSPEREAPDVEANLQKCRWFTRGWTLQELIAPHSVEFYTSSWTFLSTRSQLHKVLSSITGIDAALLLKNKTLSEISVARRMSFAANRRTSRIEDRAYSLLGMFDVNMPLIYGEGDKAFARLQEAIMQTTYDQSLFAWGTFVERSVRQIDEEQLDGLKPIPWLPRDKRGQLLGLFAKSPDDFANSGDIVPVDHPYVHHADRTRPPQVVNRGVLMDLVIHKSLSGVAYWDVPPLTKPVKLDVALLLCQLGQKGSKLIAIPLLPWGEDYFARTPELLVVECFVSSGRFSAKARRRHILPEEHYRLRHGDIFCRRWMASYHCEGVDRPVRENGPAWRQKCADQIIRPEAVVNGDEEITFFYTTRRTGGGLAVTLKRQIPPPVSPEPEKAAPGDPFDLAESDASEGKALGALVVGVSPFMSSQSHLTRRKDGDAGVPDWRPLHGAPFSEPAWSHVMEAPIDRWSWQSDEQEGREDMPHVYVRTQRVTFDRWSDDAIDVLDLFIYPEGPLARGAKRCIESDPEVPDPDGHIMEVSKHEGNFAGENVRRLAIGWVHGQYLSADLERHPESMQATQQHQQQHP